MTLLLRRLVVLLAGCLLAALATNPQGRFVGLADLLRRGVVDRTVIIYNVWSVRCV